MSEDLALARAEYGFERLGPVVAYFLHDLDGVLERLVAQRNGCALFVSRGGLLIKRALDVYREARGLAPRPGEAPFYVSRFLAAKGAWLRAPEKALALIDREFRAGTAATYHKRLLADGRRVDDETLYPSFSAFLDAGGKLPELCRAHLEEQAKLFERYLDGLFADAPLAALVDTGWQGTIQSLLTRTFPNRELWGLNFGRHGDEIDPEIAPRLFGLGFSGGHDPRKPLSAIVHHRHLIEALFEPAMASIEALEERKGAVVPVGVEAGSVGDLAPGQPALFGGVLRYLQEVAAGQSYSALTRAKDAAAERLADDILHPSRETARLLGSFNRSIDFGRRDGIDVLVDPAGPDELPEERIRTALWTQGQLALECRPAIARERQRALMPKRPRGQPARSDARAWDPARPKVAIVMRTMDRIIFLQRAFESVCRQTFDDYVLVVFNDGGDVAGVESELAASRLDRRKVILLDGVENRGMEAASNAAIAHVDSQYIIIHDDDDTWISQFLGKAAVVLDTEDEMSGVVCRSNYIEEEISGDKVVTRRRTVYNEGLNSIHIGDLLSVNKFPPISFLFRRESYDEVGGFNEKLPVLGDWDFNIRVATRGCIGVIRECLANYHCRPAREGGTYSNSIVGGSDLHMKYNSVVRRNILNDETLRSLAGATALAPMLSDIQRMLWAAEGPRPDTAALVLAADHRWCVLAYAKARPESLEALDLAAALQHAEARGVPIPPDFDEVAYLSRNKDVAELVSSGRYPSGYVHYVLRGHAEGRRRATQVANSLALP